MRRLLQCLARGRVAHGGDLGERTVNRVKHDTTTCDACGAQGGTACGRLPDNGWTLPFTSFGYHGGFTDDYDRDEAWLMCHDCVVKFLTLFPRLAKSISGGHPTPSGARCCEFAWEYDEKFGSG